MKYFPILLLALSLGFACSSKTEYPDTLPMKVALAYGYEDFDDLNSISYTWNVRRDSATVITRDWKWNIKERTVYYATADTSYTYSLDMPSDSLPVADKGFINDKYWLLFPFQLAWDKGYTFETKENVTAPISGKNTTLLTIVYDAVEQDPKVTGYTPGDAYDLYLDENNMILEWVFRRENGTEGRATTWEDVRDFGPIKIATSHANDKGEKFIWFSNVSVD
jgi:hypothetical protein